MVAKERRTLDIETRMRDFVSKAAAKMGAAIKRFASNTRKRFAAIRKAVVSVRGAIVAFAAALGARKLVGALQTTGDRLAELGLMADRVGATVESLSALQAIAADNGLTFEDLGSAMDAFSVSVDQAKEGSTAKVEAMARLGIALDDVAGKEVDLIALIKTLSANFDNVTDATARSRAMQELFSGAGAKLLPIIKQTNDQLERQVAIAREGGFVFDEQQVAVATRFGAAVDRVARTLQAIAADVFQRFAPQLTTFLNELAEFIVANREQILGSLIRIGDSFISLASVIGGSLERMLGAFQALTNSLAFLANSVSLTFLGIEAVIKRFAGASQKELVSLYANLLDRSLAYEESAKAAFDGFKKLFTAHASDLKKTEEAWRKLADRMNTTFEEGEQKAQGFFAGVGRGFETMIAGWADSTRAGVRFANEVGGAIENSLTSAIDDYVEGTKSANRAIKDLGRNILDELKKIIIRTLILRAIGGLASGAGNFVAGLFADDKKGGDTTTSQNLAEGGVTGPIGRPKPLRFYQRGGIARTPQVAVFAEAGQPEAFVPLPDGRTIPVTLAGAGASDTTVVNVFNQVNALDSRSVASWFTANRENIAREMDRALVTRAASRRSVRRVR